MSEVGKKQPQILIGDGGSRYRQGSTFRVQRVCSLAPLILHSEQ